MVNNVLTSSQIESRLEEIYKTAEMGRYTLDRLHRALSAFQEEMDSVSSSGRRRYTREVASYARGYSNALHRRMVNEKIEFVYRDSSGNLYGVGRDTTHTSVQVLIDTDRAGEMIGMEYNHVWRGTSDVLGLWTRLDLSKEAK